MRTLLVLVALLALPASAQAADPFTVTAADGSVHRATAADLAHWTTVGRRGGVSREAARAQAFRLLLDSAWIRGEAAERGLAVTHEQVVRRFRRQRDRVFRTRRQYRRFLRTSGQTVDDLLFVVHTDMLSDRIRADVLAPATASVTEADVDAYLAEHGAPRLPERRDLRIVLTRSRSAALAARRELLSGASWGAVARRYSIDEASRAQNGRLPEVQRHTLEHRLNGAVFQARPRRVVGPVRTHLGYYVFRVTRVHPARDMPEADARENARAVLVSEAQVAALESFVTEFRAKWRARTACAPRWRSEPDCGR